MHEQSINLMKRFAREVPVGSKVLDVGSRDVNGTFKDSFTHCEYTGIDIEAGKNVDIVVEPYNYPFPDESFPYIISGSTLEHVCHPWRWIKEVSRILQKGGKLCIIVPYQHSYHEHPVDCWRIYPEGMRALFEEGGLTTITAEMHDGSYGGVHPIIGEIVIYNTEGFCDTLAIATK